MAIFELEEIRYLWRGLFVADVDAGDLARVETPRSFAAQTVDRSWIQLRLRRLVDWHSVVDVFHRTC